MSTILVLLFLAALVAFVVTRKSNQPLKPLVGNVKKVEAAVVKAAEVATNALDVKLHQRRVSNEKTTTSFISSTPTTSTGYRSGETWQL